MVLDKENEGEKWPSAELLDRRRGILGQRLITTGFQSWAFRLPFKVDDAIRVLVLNDTRFPLKTVQMYTAFCRKRDRTRRFSITTETQKGRGVEEEKIRVMRPGATKSKGQGNQDWAAGLLIAIWEGSTKTQV